MTVVAAALAGLALFVAPNAVDTRDGSVPERLHGRVREARAEGESLSRLPLAGAHVIVGVGLSLEVGADGTDAVVANGPDGQVDGVVTGSDGAFVAPCPSEPGADVLVWCAGFLPVLRQSVTPAREVDVVLSRSPTPDLHRALRLPTGRLVLGSTGIDVGLPYVNSSLGLLFPIPDGFNRVDAADPMTILSLTDGWSRLMILRAPEYLDRDRLAELLREQLREAQEDDASLQRSIDVEVDGRRAVLREFVGRTARTCAVYASRRDKSLVFLLASPRSRYEEDLAGFLAAIDAARFTGGPPQPPETGVVLASSAIGVRVVLPEQWRPLARAGPELAAELPTSRCTARVTAVPSEGADPRPVVEAVLSGLDVRQEIDERWDLVAGTAGYTRTAVVGRAPGSAPMCLTVVAFPAGTHAVVARFEYPRYARSGCAPHLLRFVDCMTLMAPG